MHGRPAAAGEDAEQRGERGGGGRRPRPRQWHHQLEGVGDERRVRGELHGAARLDRDGDPRALGAAAREGRLPPGDVGIPRLAGGPSRGRRAIARQSYVSQKRAWRSQRGRTAYQQSGASSQR